MVSPVYHQLKKSRRLAYDLGHCSLQPIDKKCKFTVVPGQSKSRRPGKDSEYGKQLKAKQMLRFYYGVSEKQFVGYFKKADHCQGSTAYNLMMLLESRLDNLVYRMGFACTRPAARQLVSHGHFMVNGQKVTIASYQVQIGDQIEVHDKSKKLESLVSSIEDITKQRPNSDWLELDLEKLLGIYTMYPTIEQLPPEFNPASVVELYSK